MKVENVVIILHRTNRTLNNVKCLIWKILGMLYQPQIVLVHFSMPTSTETESVVRESLPPLSLLDRVSASQQTQIKLTNLGTAEKR